MQEFFGIVTRKISAPLPRETALAILADLSLCPIYSPVPADVLAAERLAGEVKISFWDAMLLVAAKAFQGETVLVRGFGTRPDRGGSPDLQSILGELTSEVLDSVVGRRSKRVAPISGDQELE